MSKQQKQSQKSQSPQGETAPDADEMRTFKIHGHASGIPGSEGKVNYTQHYEGNVGDNPRYQTQSDTPRKRGKAPTSEAQRVPGSDAESGNIGLSK
ncbi:MAG TPA: hypothetical protein VK647_05515 [Gemmatimonadales bacterium]|jgi:hypothetical protein|nr:hypothetical protein [Gemmatimonadales bacterium]